MLCMETACVENMPAFPNLRLIKQDKYKISDLKYLFLKRVQKPGVEFFCLKNTWEMIEGKEEFIKLIYQTSVKVVHNNVYMIYPHICGKHLPFTCVCEAHKGQVVSGECSVRGRGHGLLKWWQQINKMSKSFKIITHTRWKSKHINPQSDPHFISVWELRSRSHRHCSFNTDWIFVLINQIQVDPTWCELSLNSQVES